MDLIIQSRIPKYSNRMAEPDGSYPIAFQLASVDVNQTFDTFANWSERFHNTFATWLQSVGLPNIR